MRILFLGDVVGISGCSKIASSLLSEIKSKKIDFVIANGENAAAQGVGKSMLEKMEKILELMNLVEVHHLKKYINILV